MQEIHNISFNETHFFSKLIIDYVAQNTALKNMYNVDVDIHYFEQLMQQKTTENIDREILVTEIKNQYSDFVCTKNVEENIKILRDKNTFCIVTAHQLNIFGGPLYYIIKIACTIKTCLQLKEKYPNYNFVPVYWMGSEDHDFDEINHIFLYNKKIEWNEFQGGATGEYATQNIQNCITEIEQILGNNKYSAELLTIFKNAYSKNNLADASRCFLNEIFGNNGLVIIDGNCTVFKQQMTEIFINEIEKNTAYNLVVNQNKNIEKLGYKPQATVREINLFYKDKNRRERIVFNTETNHYEVLNTDLVFTKNSLITLIKINPEKISPNVILRPLFQQKILPSLAYIGGGGEIAYWLQLKPIFDFYNIQFPMLLVRNSMLFLDEKLNAKIEKLQLKITDFFYDLENIKKNFLASKNDIYSIEKYQNKINFIFNEIKNEVKEIDISLISFIEAEEKKQFNNFDIIEKKISKSLKQKNEIQLNQIEKIKNQIFPQNNLQERIENFSSYYSMYGNAFINELINQVDIFGKQFVITLL